MLKRIHHIGVVVPNLEDAYRFWRDTLGLEFTRSATIEEQGVKAALLKVGDSEIELLEPLSPDNGVGKFLARRGGGLHHLCFETDDVGRELEGARAKGLGPMSRWGDNTITASFRLSRTSRQSFNFGRRFQLSLRIPVRREVSKGAGGVTCVKAA